jgi:hypothetical protein
MTHDAHLSAAQRRDQQVERYILALDRGDFDAVAAILAAAETDPELDRLLVEVDAALHAEAGLTTRTEDAKTVRTLLRKHLPSAFAEPETGPPTVGQVATRLQADHDSGKHVLLPGDLHANAQLLGQTIPLTGRLTPRTIRQATEPLGVQASDRYWELFRRAAGELALTRAGAVHQAAARPRSSRRRRPAGQGSEES